MFIRAVIIYIIGLFLLILFFGLMLQWSTTPSNAHDWYTGIKNEIGQACCGGRDCAAISDQYVRVVPGGYEVHLPALHKFAWPEIHAFVSNDRAKPAPTGGEYHLCFWGGEVKCFFFPAPSF